MNRFLNLASKALAVVGVLTLMWTAGGMQQAKADFPPGGFNCYVSGNSCAGWLCPATTCCCYIVGPITDDSGTHCCDKVCVPC